ncbi:hypothetical protein H2200_002193 [Cladophialophora chaetospira]|uniref:Uncharacterized protein n=1 Tax=Cladophialophora chaetospira TaxID=386627 RepID=A0AA38XIF4_9EURO|nr:hypothetical protein H2200_002193 [Cladophialophora chaetospira]
MSSPSSELSWLSSDEVEALQASNESEDEVKEQQPVWHNKWTPINQFVSSSISPPPSPPLSDQDIGEDDEPSQSASHLRHLILTSAHRLNETKTARKRKLKTSTPTPRKRRAITTISEDVDDPTIQAQEKKPTVKKARAPLQPRSTQPQGSDSLLPNRASKLNATFSVEKRTASQAFETEIDPRPVKRLQTIKGGNDSAAPCSTDSMAKANAEHFGVVNKGSEANPHSDIENVKPTACEVPEDLFDSDDSCIEELLEFERTLFGDSMASSPLPTTDAHLASQVPERPNDTFETARSNATPSPMKPFVRPFTPLRSSQDTSPAGSVVSPLYRSPLCFRLADAIRYVKTAFFTSPTSSAKMLNLDLYAILTSSTDNDITTTVTLADIFFPSKPPYLEATARQAIVALALSEKNETPSSGELWKSKDNLIHAVIQVTPKLATELGSAIEPSVSPINLLAGRYTAMVLKIRRANWAEIERMKNILDANSTPDSSASANRAVGAAMK